MNCSNCQIMKKDVPCIPAGNDFKIAIALKEIIKADGEVSERDIDIASITSVAVIKPNGDAVDNAQNKVYSYALNGSTLILNFANQEGVNALPKGKYGIEVKGKRTEDSSDFCFSLPPGLAFEIVADSAHGYFPSDSIITYTVNGVVGVAQNVSSGGGGGSVEQVQADWNETNTSSKAFIKNKPTIPDAQIQADWNQTTMTAKDYIKNKPTIPSVSGLASQEWVGQQGFLTAHQDITGKEDKLSITTPTITNNALTLTVGDLGKFFKLGTLTANTVITLPNMANEDVTHIVGCIFDVTIGTNGGLDFNATQDIYENGLSNIEDGKRYEINVIYATEWRITAIELSEYTTT